MKRSNNKARKQAENTSWIEATSLKRLGVIIRVQMEQSARQDDHRSGLNAVARVLCAAA